MVKIKDEILHGFMDFVAMDDTSMTIIDFKTDRLDTPEEFIKLYRSQLSSIRMQCVFYILIKHVKRIYMLFIYVPLYK